MNLTFLATDTKIKKREREGPNKADVGIKNIIYYNIYKDEIHANRLETWIILEISKH